MYDATNMTLTPEAEAAMVHYLNNDPKKKVYGKHIYREGVYFDKEFFEENFKEYIDLMSKRIGRENVI